MSEVVYSARWILPVSRPPIIGGWVAIAEDRIVALGHAKQPPPNKPIDLGDVAILPALINAHTHLEFSYLTKPIGFPGTKLYDWIGEVIRSRNVESDSITSDPAEAIREGLRMCQIAGTGLVGDIATTPFPNAELMEIEPTALVAGRVGHTNSDVEPEASAYGSGQQAGITEVVSMAEVLGLTPSRSDSKIAAAIDHAKRFENNQTFHAGISPHAPYSTPLIVVRQCVEIANRLNLPLAMHVAESIEERTLLERGDGPFADRLREIRVYSDSIFPWGQDATLELLTLLAQAPRVLVIHGNDLNDGEIGLLAKHRHLTVVYCPRTHAYFDHSVHPVAKLAAAGIRVALGTDSLASNPDLSVWGEVQWLLAHRQDIDWQVVISMATIAGAEAFARPDFGRIETGSKARLLVIPTDATSANDLPTSFLLNHPCWLMR